MGKHELLLERDMQKYAVQYTHGVMSNVRMPGMLSIGICRTPSLKQESPG